MKIIADKQDKRYEVTFLVSSIYSETEANQVKAGVVEAIEKLSGTAEIQDDWGKKALAYPIKAHGSKHTEAYYFYMEVVMDPAKVIELSRELELRDRVLRYLVIKAE